MLSALLTSSAVINSLSLQLLQVVLVCYLGVYFTRQWYLLRDIPGPIPAKLTNLWRYCLVRRRQSHQEYLELHQKYGDFLRIGPKCVSICKPDLINKIYGINKGFVKSDYYSVWQNVVKGKRAISLVFTTDENAHAKVKRPIASAFSLSNLVEYEPLLDSTSAVFLSQLDEMFANSGKACNLGDWLQWYAFDVMGELTFNKRLGFLERGEDVEGIIASIATNFDRCSVLGQMPWLDSILYKNPLYLKFARPPTNPVLAFGKRRLNERTKKEDEKARPQTTIKDPSLRQKLEQALSTKLKDADFLSRYLQVHHERPDVVDDTMLLALLFANINAGSDTVASTMRAIFYHLLKSPLTMARLLVELDEVSAAGTLSTPLPTWNEVQKLPYLNAVIAEALRLNPALSLPMERIVPHGGLMVDGTFFKPGTMVGINPWILHRDARIFGPLDPESWHPERWLDSDQEKIKHMEANMLTFSAGSRTCLGRHVAILEMSKIVPAVLLRYKMKLEREDQEWKIWNAWIIRQEGLDVVLERR